MARFLLRRVLFMALTLWLVSLTIFIVTEVLPGDVATAVMGQEATEEDLARTRERLGLDRSRLLRYVEWVGGAVRGDLGESYRCLETTGKDCSVTLKIAGRLGNSVTLALLTLLVGVPLSLTLGVVAALYRGRLIDGALSASMLAAVSVPEFVNGLVLILFFGVWLQWLPTASILTPGVRLLEQWTVLVLPAATLVAVMLAHTARQTRAGMVQVLESNFIRTAVLKGLPWRTVVTKHALRNALLPAITVIAMNTGWLVGGLIIVENVFSFPGVGKLLLEAVENRDVPLLQGVAILVALVYAGANLLADLLYARLNPRIRYS
ncbi:MAG: peptide ABC transporter permease [Dehalococcoidia bacterium]|nr:peptide ABC transporter permease [Dehalococcoidia bacterium]